MLPKYFEFCCPVKILSGRKAVTNIPYELKSRGCKRPLVVTDKGIVDANLIKIIEAAFADSDIDIGGVYDDTPPDSSVAVVQAVAESFRHNDCDSILAVGGGSAMDTAKAANIVLCEDCDDLLDLQGFDRVQANLYPFVAVPTTAGTGSEVTAVAVIYNETVQAKMAFSSIKLLPDVAVVDPAMTMTMPPKITAATGMDALTHAAEAFYCLQKNPVSDAFASTAITLTREHLVDAVKNSEDEVARMGMANAALLAGIAFSNSMVGMVHALAHATGSEAHVPHGVANAIFLPFGMEYNLGRVDSHLADVAVLLDPDAERLVMKDRAARAPALVRELTAQLNQLCGMPTRLRDAGVSRDQLERIARLSIDDGAVTFNPEELTYEESLEVLNAAF